MKFYFDVIENFVKTVCVEAESLPEARKIIEKSWSEGKIVINHEYSDDVKFKPCQEAVQTSINEGFIDETEIESFDNSILSDTEKESAKHVYVHSSQIYSPQSYLELVTGNCYIVDGDNDVEFIEKILEKFDFCLWSHAFEEIEYIVEEKLQVVLVDCMIYNTKTEKYEHVYRWFEIP